MTSGMYCIAVCVVGGGGGGGGGGMVGPEGLVV